MKTFKQNFTKTLMSLEQINFLWGLFDNIYQHSNPAKAFAQANSGEFRKSILNFNPTLTPFSDYKMWMSKITISEKSVIARVEKMLVDEDKINTGQYTEYVNGKKKVWKDPEYFRFVLIHVLAAPFNKSKAPYKILLSVSEPRRFKTNKGYRFTFPHTYTQKSDFTSYRIIRSFALSYNFFYSKEINSDGTPVLVECPFSLSETEPFIALLQ